MNNKKKNNKNELLMDEKEFNKLVNNCIINNERFAMQSIFYISAIYPICFILLVVFNSSISIWPVLVIMLLPLVLIGFDLKKCQENEKLILTIMDIESGSKKKFITDDTRELIQMNLMKRLDNKKRTIQYY